MIPIYVSLTSIFKNQSLLTKTLHSILKQTLKPDKIFIYLSDKPYMLDNGFKDYIITDNNLQTLINNNNIFIKWVINIGSYRKLIPILQDKWNEDCIIITIDDDTIYDDNLIKNLVSDYNKYNCVIGYRGFTPACDKLKNFNYLKRSNTKNLHLYNFLTGKGGILYKPQFFHNTNNLIFNKIYLDICPGQDDLWFYIVRILNNINCYTSNTKYMTKDLLNDGLYVHYNRNNNHNTVTFNSIISSLKKLNYIN